MPSRVRVHLPDPIRGRRARAGFRRRRDGERGQALLEFAFIIPVMMLVMIGIIEFALAFNATLGVNRASQDAALIASEAGNLPGADCMILRSIESDVTSPANASEITEVQIQRTNPSGTTVFANNSYTRSGATTCTLADGTTVTVPYSATGTGYPPSQRCNILGGCPLLTPARTTVDTIGIQISYRYAWRTPLSAIMDVVGGAPAGSSVFAFTQRNAFRMEPQL
jgi:Flp pilus assembly protein TadG